MKRAVLRAAALGQLRSADLELAPGRYVLLSSERDALRDFVALLAGREPPRAGRVLVDGRPPSDSPALRRKLAALFDDEALAPARSVLDSVTSALEARGSAVRDARSLLADAGLENYAGVSPNALSTREARSVALALALAHDAAELLVLYEPLSTSLPRRRVLEALDRHTARGAIVVTATTHPADATLLGGSWLCVELGRVRAGAGQAPRLGAGPWQQLSVEVDDARALSLLLHGSPLGLTTELGSEPHQLKVTGPALDLTAREVIALARREGLEVRRISAAVPPVEALMAARAGFARGAYEAARAAALGSAPAPLPTPPGSPGSPGGVT